MQPIRHRYAPFWFWKTSTNLYNTAGFIAPLLILAIPMVDLISNHKPATLGGVIAMLYFGAIASLTCFLTGNYLPEIVSDIDGLHINFLWKQVFLPWEKVVDLKPLFNMRFLKNIMILRTHSLTPFHRLYGLFYSFSLHPSIMISKGISNYDELIRRIRVALKKNKLT